MIGIWKSQNARKIQNSAQGAVAWAPHHKIRPAANAHALMHRSAASHRSAIWPQTIGASTEPKAAAEQIQAVSGLVSASDLRYGPNTGDHAPMIAYCRNIITDRRTGNAATFLAL